MDSQKGLYQKYIIHKADGSPVDPDAVYFVLRVDDQGGEGIGPARTALAVYSRRICAVNRQLADDIDKLLGQFGPSWQREAASRPTLKEGWTLPVQKCPDCGVTMRPSVYDTGEGWYLAWYCPDDCVDDLEIEWPFVEGQASRFDFEAIGFEVI